MELASKQLEQIAFDRRPEFREHMLIGVDKSTQETSLSQPLHTNKKQYITAVTFLVIMASLRLLTKTIIFFSKHQLRMITST